MSLTSLSRSNLSIAHIRPILASFTKSKRLSLLAYFIAADATKRWLLLTNIVTASFLTLLSPLRAFMSKSLSSDLDNILYLRISLKYVVTSPTRWQYVVF